MVVALGTYALALPWLARQGGAVLLLCPNLWLLGWMTILWRLGRPWSLHLFGGGRRTGWMLALLGLAAVCMVAFAVWWPEGNGNPGGVKGSSAALILLVPLAEELFFRGLLLAELRRRCGSLVAVVLVTAVFAAMHVPMGQHVPMGVLALVLCAVTLASGSVLWAIGLHAAWNTLAVTKSIAPGLERGSVVLVALLFLACVAAWGHASRYGEGPK
jgi:membrane protease YdiL (CAAX protease family)